MDTNIKLEEVSFLRSPEDDEYDMLVAYRQEYTEFKTAGVNFPARPPDPSVLSGPRPTICVASDLDFRKEIKRCKQTMNDVSCQIEVCRFILPEKGSNVSVFNTSNNNGIDITNMNIIFSCEESCLSKCVFDGWGRYRLFYGSSANVTFYNFIFSNGLHPTNGGAIKVENNSILNLINCSFVNNSAPFGSAVYVSNSKLYVNGIESNIVNNTGISPPFEVVSSQMNMSHAVFAGNTASEYQAAILLYDSIVNYSDVHVLRLATMLDNTGIPKEDCDVYVAMDANNYTNRSSCLQFDESKKSFPIIDLSATCATPAPTPAPTLAPTPVRTPVPTLPTSCFSGYNMVDTKDRGIVPMNSLHIGEWVLSSLDGVYTQVYGFGHYHPYLKSAFLHITFDSNDSIANQTSSTQTPLLFPPSVFLEISDRHLVMVETNQRQYRIPASEVRVGDNLSGYHVKTIQQVTRYGVYAPLTQSGEIVVAGILASNYVKLLDSPMMMTMPWDHHTLAHNLFRPQQLFCHWVISVCQQEIYFNGYGLLAYLLVACSSVIQSGQSRFDSSVSLQSVFLYNVALFILITAAVQTRKRFVGSS
jgi:Hint module